VSSSSSEHDDRARKQAEAKLETVVQYVHRLRHIEECSGAGECSVTDEEILSALGFSSESLARAAISIEALREQYHDREDALEYIYELPLEICVRTGWEPVGGPRKRLADEYYILLCSGGPAVRIWGELDDYGEPCTAVLEYQDWFTEWVPHTGGHQHKDELLEFARCFSYTMP